VTYLNEALIQGSLLLLTVSLIIGLLRRVLSLGGKLLLHKLVYLRFLLPSVFLMTFSSSYFVADSASLISASEKITSRPLLKTNISSEHLSATPLEISPLSMGKAFEWPLFEMWLCGVCLCLAFMLYLNLTQRKKLNSRKLLCDKRAQDLLRDCCHQLGIKKILELSESCLLTSPALYGLIRPEIILPHGLVHQLTEEELKHVFLHELSHFKKADNWWNCFFSLIQIINWYNPLVWYFRSKTQELQEQACDARVIGSLVDAKAYGSTLIKVLEQSNLVQNPSLCAVVYLNENNKQLKRRIKMLKTKQSKYGVIFSVLVVTGMACMGWEIPADPKAATQVKPAVSEIAKEPGAINNEGIKKIIIKSQFIQGDNEILSAPTVVTQEDHTAIIRVVEEKYLPEAWEKPEIKTNNGELHLYPAKPVFGESSDIGVSLELSPSLLEHPKFSGQIHLSGKIKLSKIADSKISQIKHNDGSMDNHVVATETKEAIFTLVTAKDKVSEITMNYEGKPLTIKIEAKVIEQ